MPDCNAVIRLVRLLATTLAFTSLLPACRSAPEADQPQPPETHADYAAAMSAGPLAATFATQRWQALARAGLSSPMRVESPYRETVALHADTPRADSWRVSLAPGQTLSVTVNPVGDFEGELYLDVLEIVAGEPGGLGESGDAGESNAGSEVFVAVDAQRIALGGRASSTYGYEPGPGADVLVRLQGALLAAGAFEIIIATPPVLAFPVDGVPDSAVRSFYGDVRAGGKRSHEGIDIFAKKGTPVIAVADGMIVRVGTSKLGGTHIWQRDLSAGRSYYYAHLSASLVAGGDSVQAGQPIGLVGNTGNAKFTPPHLHFGIYPRRGEAADPWPYVSRSELPDGVTIPAMRWARTRTDGLNFRAGPGTRNASLSTLSIGQGVQVLGAAGDWWRVRRPSSEVGYVFSGLLTQTDAPLAAEVLAAPVLLRARPEAAAPVVARISAGDTVSVLAVDARARLLRSAAGDQGWVLNTGGTARPAG